MEELTWPELKDIISSSKPSRFQQPDWTKVEFVVAKKLEVKQDDRLKAALIPFQKKFKGLIAAKRIVYSSGREAQEESMTLKRKDLNIEVPEEAPEEVKKRRKSFVNLGDRMRRERTDDILKEITEY